MSNAPTLREIANRIEEQDRQFYEQVGDLLDKMGVPRRPPCKVVKLTPATGTDPAPISENITLRK